MQRLSALFRNRSWLLRAVLAPLLITRLALLMIGYFSLELKPDPGYPLTNDVLRGWSNTPHRWLDIWGRWDSGWYMSIAIDGYQPPADLASQQSSLAFFPLYPYLVRLLAASLPGDLNPRQALLVGVLISNLCLLGSCILLYQLARQLLQDDLLAGRAVWYLLLFPAGFILSAFYTESLFLFLLLLAFWSAQNERWSLAGLSGFFLALTRPPGVLLFPAITWLYLEQRGWSLRPWKWPRLDVRILWLLLIPLGLAVFLLIGYQVTGDWLASIHAQSAWGWDTTWPWRNLLTIDPYHPQVSLMEHLSLVIFFLLSLFALARLSSPSYGIYALLLILPASTAGGLVFLTRLCMTCFPAFIVLAWLGRRWRFLDQLVLVIFLALQAVLFAMWCQFYWVG